MGPAGARGGSRTLSAMLGSLAMPSSGLPDSTQPVGNDFALGIEARSRALLTDGAAAENLYREAIDRLGRTPRRSELARAYLRLWRVAAPFEPSPGGAGAAADGRADVRRDRDGGVRRPRPGRAGRRRREAQHASPGDPRGAHGPGGADRPARPRWAHQHADRHRSCSSAPAPSNTTCTRCSASWGSTRAVASEAVLPGPEP